MNLDELSYMSQSCKSKKGHCSLAPQTHDIMTRQLKQCALSHPPARNSHRHRRNNHCRCRHNPAIAQTPWRKKQVTQHAVLMCIGAIPLVLLALPNRCRHPSQNISHNHCAPTAKPPADSTVTMVPAWFTPRTRHIDVAFWQTYCHHKYFQHSPETVAAPPETCTHPLPWCCTIDSHSPRETTQPTNWQQCSHILTLGICTIHMTLVQWMWYLPYMTTRATFLKSHTSLMQPLLLHSQSFSILAIYLLQQPYSSSWTTITCTVLWTHYEFRVGAEPGTLPSLLANGQTFIEGKAQQCFTTQCGKEMSRNWAQWKWYYLLYITSGDYLWLMFMGRFLPQTESGIAKILS